MTHYGMDKNLNIVPLPKEKRMDMIKCVNTAEAGIEVSLSFSDSLLGDTEHVLLQIGSEGVGFKCAYLTERQTEELYQAICHARNLWKFGE